MRWTIEGFQSAMPTGFSREESGTEQQITCLLKRLAARHLTDDEITDAISASSAHFEIIRDKRPGKPMQLSTTGTDHHYVATELRNS
jgi:hypothetical protein